MFCWILQVCDGLGREHENHCNYPIYYIIKYGWGLKGAPRLTMGGVGFSKMRFLNENYQDVSNISKAFRFRPEEEAISSETLQ